MWKILQNRKIGEQLNGSVRDESEDVLASSRTMDLCQDKDPTENRQTFDKESSDREMFEYNS